MRRRRTNLNGRLPAEVMSPVAHSMLGTKSEGGIGMNLEPTQLDPAHRDPTHSEEIQRLQFLESDAERRYDEAVERLDNASAATAAQDWKNACEALDTLFEQSAAASARDGSRSAIAQQVLQ
jgi:hypothetical protein